MVFFALLNGHEHFAIKSTFSFFFSIISSSVLELEPLLIMPFFSLIRPTQLINKNIVVEVLPFLLKSPLLFIERQLVKGNHFMQPAERSSPTRCCTDDSEVTLHQSPDISLDLVVYAPQQEDRQPSSRRFGADLKIAIVDEDSAVVMAKLNLRDVRRQGGLCSADVLRSHHPHSLETAESNGVSASFGSSDDTPVDAKARSTGFRGDLNEAEQRLRVAVDHERSRMLALRAAAFDADQVLAQHGKTFLKMLLLEAHLHDPSKVSREKLHSLVNVVSSSDDALGHHQLALDIAAERLF